MSVDNFVFLKIMPINKIKNKIKNKNNLHNCEPFPYEKINII